MKESDFDSDLIKEKQLLLSVVIKSRPVSRERWKGPEELKNKPQNVICGIQYNLLGGYQNTWSIN